LVRTIECRIFRSTLLSGYIHEFERLAQPAAIDATAVAIPPPTGNRTISWCTLAQMTSNEDKASWRLRELVQLLRLRILAAELGGTALPEDPFAPGHQVQAKIVAGWNVRYSIGPDRIDNGGGRGDVVMRLYPEPTSASSPAVR
jgi:hypothetical protein